MTSVEELATPTHPTLATAYANERGTLYRALVLSTGNRDVAVEAIDRAYTRWQSKRASRRTDPSLQVFAGAYGWAARRMRRPDRMIQGFRLSGAQDIDTDDSLLRHFDELELMDRTLLTCQHYLGWDSNRAAIAIGIPPGEALPRSSAAMSRLGRNSGLDVTALSARLPAALTGRAEALPEPLERIESVQSRARMRRISVTAGSTLAGLVLATGVGFGVQQIIDGPEPSPADGTVISGTQGSEAVSIFAADTLIWEQVPVPIREGDLNSVAFGPAGFVAIGQDWSGGNQQSLSLLSDDGVFWEVGPGPAEGPNAWVNQMVVAGDRYVAVGSGWNDFDGSEAPFVSVSDDGITWSSISLPIETDIELGGRLVNLWTSVQSIAADGDRIIVLANQNAEFDPSQLIREAIGDDVGLDNWGWSPQGIELYTFDGQLEQRISWDEIGVDAETVRFITNGRPVMMATDDLSTWETLPLAGFGPNSWVGNLVMLNGKIAAVVYGNFGPSLWVSDDGTEWEEDDVFEPGTSINAVSTIGDRAIAVGTDASGAGAAWTSADLAVWTPVTMPIDSAWLHQVQTSDAGIAIIGERGGGVIGPAEVFVGDLTIQVSQNGGYTVIGGDGDVIARMASAETVVYEDDMIILKDPDTLEEIVSFDQREIDQAWESLWREQEVNNNNGPQWLLLLSRDGETWTSHDLTESIGTGFYPNAVAVGPQSVVMTGWQEGGGFVDDFIGGGSSGVTVWVATAD